MSQVPSNSLSVYKNKPFTRFAKKARITAADLWNAALHANLGGGVIKQRIARTGEGKSGGSRTIILFRKDDRAVYVFGFEKKDMANISAKDLMAFREFAAIYLGYTAAEMDGLVRNGTLYQIQRPEGEMR
jgi:hypothetical protein